MKKFSLFLILLLLFTCSFSYAGQASDIAKNLGLNNVDPKPVEGIDAGQILGIVQWVGYVIAIGMIIFCGIKFVMSGAGQKAKVKETLVPVVIGAIILASAVTITKAAFNIFSNSSEVTEQAE